MKREALAVAWADHKKNDVPTKKHKRLAAEHQKKKQKKICTLGDMRLYICPVCWLDQQALKIVRFVIRCHTTKFLYIGGGWADQPQWFIDVWDMIDLETMKNKQEKS